MKTTYLILLLTLPFVGLGQDMKVKWEDDDGREFSIKVLSGEFGFGMIPGDKISYTYGGNVSKVGSVKISYTYTGKVNRVGDVTISYTYNGRVSKVGGMTISYNYNGKVTGTRGRVR